MDDIVKEEIVELLSSGQKIAAIKHYREATGASLAEAKRAVEEIGAGRSLNLEESDLSDLAGEILEFLDQGQKIQAIKVYRERTNAGLKEAKDVVEEIAAKAGIEATSGSGCAGVALAAATGLAGTAAAMVALVRGVS